jgi:hypothetical protein
MNTQDAREIVDLLARVPAQCALVDYRGPRAELFLTEDPWRGDMRALVVALRDCNHRLWHLEDEARRTDAGDAHVAAVKRAIDRWNQHRSDLTECIDRQFLATLPSADPRHAVLSSETPGMILDRLSILSLKIFHLTGLSARGLSSAIETEILEKVAILEGQQRDLANCFIELISDAAEGRRYFKLYRQFKAYNDARLNPALSRAS